MTYMGRKRLNETPQEIIDILSYVGDVLANTHPHHMFRLNYPNDLIHHEITLFQLDKNQNILQTWKIKDDTGDACLQNSGDVSWPLADPKCFEKLEKYRTSENISHPPISARLIDELITDIKMWNFTDSIIILQDNKYRP